MTDLHQIGRDPNGVPLFVDHDPDAAYGGVQYADGRAYTGYVATTDDEFVELGVWLMSQPLDPGPREGDQ